MSKLNKIQLQREVAALYAQMLTTPTFWSEGYFTVNDYLGRRPQAKNWREGDDEVIHAQFIEALTSHKYPALVKNLILMQDDRGFYLKPLGTYVVLRARLEAPLILKALETIINNEESDETQPNIKLPLTQVLGPNVVLTGKATRALKAALPHTWTTAFSKDSLILEEDGVLMYCSEAQ